MKKDILFVAAFIFVISPQYSFTAEKVSQKTVGDQSPAVNIAPGGKANFNYNVPNRAVNLLPKIKCKLAYRLKVENDVVQKKSNNPELIVTNVGAVKAVAFSVDCKGYVYDKKTAAIDGYFKLKNERHGHLIFVPELRPSEDAKAELNSYLRNGTIVIYAFTLNYYRESDMKQFKRQDMFFVENNTIFAENDYLKNTNYPKIVQAIKSYRPTSDMALSFNAIDDHAWLVTETPKTGLIMLDSERKGLSVDAIPEDPRTSIKQNYLNENRPLLYIRPLQLKDTGTYLSPDIIDDHTVDIKMRYEIENIGVTEAIKISGREGTIYDKPLKPGEKIYLYPKMTLQNKIGHKQSPQDLVDNMNKEGYFIEHGETVLYFQESVNKEYLARFVYRIGPDKVQLIKYEIK
jgi:hypothetical protein